MARPLRLAVMCSVEAAYAQTRTSRTSDRGNGRGMLATRGLPISIQGGGRRPHCEAHVAGGAQGICNGAHDQKGQKEWQVTEGPHEARCNQLDLTIADVVSMHVYWCSTNIVPAQYQCGASASQCQRRTRVVPVQDQRTTNAVPAPIQCRGRSESELRRTISVLLTTTASESPDFAPLMGDPRR